MNNKLAQMHALRRKAKEGEKETAEHELSEKMGVKSAKKAPEVRMTSKGFQAK